MCGIFPGFSRPGSCDPSGFCRGFWESLSVFGPGSGIPGDFTLGSGKRESGNIKASALVFPRSSDFSFVESRRAFRCLSFLIYILAYFRYISVKIA